MICWVSGAQEVKYLETWGEKSAEGTKFSHHHWENKPDGYQNILALYSREPIHLSLFFSFFRFSKKNRRKKKSKENSSEKTLGNMEYNYSLFEGWWKDGCACTLLTLAAGCSKRGCVSPQPTACSSSPSFSLFLAVDSPVLFVPLSLILHLRTQLAHPLSIKQLPFEPQREPWENPQLLEHGKWV